MTTLERGDERFFFGLACAMAAIIVAGFSLNLAMGRSSFSLPLIYHVHGVVFFGWVALYLAQNWLVTSGNVALHRRLGWLSALWVPAMVVAGTLMTVAAVRRTGGPFFFDANVFLISNPLGLLAFAGLVFAAVRMRRQTDWHRRLMLCAMATLTGPGFGRILPMPLFIPWAWEVGNLVTLVFPLAGMLADRRRYGRVHPAWYWGIGISVAWLMAGIAIANTAFGVGLTERVLAGFPGAARPMGAYLP